MSFYYGYEKQNAETIGGLSSSGGTIEGDIDMQDNHILTSADPTENSHLTRKKYVDDKVAGGIGGNYLPKSVGVMTGNIYMGNNNIFSNVDPASDKHLTRKKYVDDQDAKKLSLTGGTLTGNLNIGNNKISTTTNPINDSHLSRKKYVDDKNVSLKKDVSFSILKDNFSLKFHNLFFVEYDSSYDLLFERNGGKVKQIFDFGIEGNHFKQTTKNLQPSLNLENEKLENKYFLKFNNHRMISDSNLNPISGKKDIINVFVVYKLNSVSLGTEWTKSALFGHDNGGYDKFVCFSSLKSLIISGINQEFIVIGANSANFKAPLASFKSKADAGELNKWICLSVHWDTDSSPLTDQSSVYCNGKLLQVFTSRSRTGNTKLVIGDLKNDVFAPLDGNIIFFSVLKYQKMREKEIKFYHYILCNLFNVEHDKISLK